MGDDYYYCCCLIELEIPIAVVQRRQTSLYSTLCYHCPMMIFDSMMASCIASDRLTMSASEGFGTTDWEPCLSS